MEQPNMMGPNGMPGANPMAGGGMQRPQGGNYMQQIHAKILNDLRLQSSQLPQGWQTTMNPGERSTRIIQLVSQLRFLNPDITKCISIAEHFEFTTIRDSPNKDIYLAKINEKNSQIAQKRGSNVNMNQMGGMQMNNNQNMIGMQNGMDMQQDNSMGNGMNMGMNMNMGNGMNPNMGQPNQQQFPGQLSRQMQPSQLPQGQQQPQQNSMDPSQLQNSMQQNMQNMPKPQPQQGMNPNQGAPNQGGQNQGNQALIAQEVRQMAQQYYTGLTDDKKTQMRNTFMAGLNDVQKQNLSGKGDPLMAYLIQRSRDAVMKRRQSQQMGQGGQQPNGASMNNQGSMQGNGQGGNGNFDFTNFLGQQATAMKSQESGGEVVPASNNNNFNMGGGQMNASQGNVNPQMMVNQGSQQGNNSNNNGNNNGNNGQAPNQLQAMMMQQEKAQQTNRNNMLARQQALTIQQQQASQLRGQPGGLNNPNPIQSPAMSMLTRPMMPPGQNTPGTPQQPQNRPQGMPPTPMNGMNQNPQQPMQPNMNQGGPGSQQHEAMMASRRAAFLQSLPENMRQRLNTMQPQQVNEFMMRYIQQQQQRSQQGGMNNGQNQPGMPPNMGMGGPQAGNPQAMFNGSMQQNMGNAVPGFNAQPPPNQQAQPGQMDPAALQRQQHNQLKQKAMDLRPFPAQILSQLGLAVPPTVNMWGKLKEHIMSNHAVLPPGTLEKIQQVQNQWFDAHPDEMNRGALALKQQHLQAQQQRNNSQGGMQMPPNGQAPPAQMMQPNNGMGMPNGGAGQMQPGQGMNFNVSPQEIEMMRQRLPQLQGQSDDVVRNFMIQRKMSNAQKMNQASQQQQQQLLQQQQQAALRNAQAQRVGQNAPGAMGSAAPQRPPQPPTPNQLPNAQNQGQKRPQDEIVEIPNPNGGMGAPQGMPNIAGLRPPQGFPNAQQLNKMTPADRNKWMQKIQQFESLRKAQHLANNGQGIANPAGAQTQPQAGNLGAQGGVPQSVMPQAAMDAQLKAKITAIYQEMKNTPKGPAVPYDNASKMQAQALMKKLWPPLSRVEQSFPHALRGPPPFGEQRVRDMLKAKMILQQNCLNANGDIKDYLAVSLQQLVQIQNLVSHYFMDLKTMKDNIDAQSNKQQNGAQAPGQAPPQARPTPTAAKVQPVQASPVPAKARPGQGARKPSTTKAPPAPTDNKTFDWSAHAPSPQGVPRYGVGDLTPDKLKMPPQKKRKGDSQATTPAQNATPGAGSPALQAGQKPTSSPEITKKPQPPGQNQAQLVAQQQKLEQERREAELKKKFKCTDPLCDSSLTGFETEGERDKHVEVAHKAIEDPLAFLLEGAAAAAATESKKAAPNKLLNKAGKGATPALKSESAASTPALGAKGKTAPTSAPVTKPAEPEKEKTLRDALEEKMGFDASFTSLTDTPFGNLGTKPGAPSTDASTAANDDDDFWINILAQPATETADTAADNDWIDLATDPSLSAFGVDPWALRPNGADMEFSPSLTPSDGSSVPSEPSSNTSRESDISLTEKMIINLEWDAFGDGDTSVPDALRSLAVEEKGAKDSMLSDAEKTAEETKGDGDGDGLPKGDEMDMDVLGADAEVAGDWDLLFGPEAGLAGPEFGGWMEMN